MIFNDNPCAKPIMRIAGGFSVFCLAMAFICTTWLGFYCAGLARGLAFAAIIVPAVAVMSMLKTDECERQAMTISACLAASMLCAFLFGIFLR